VARQNVLAVVRKRFPVAVSEIVREEFKKRSAQFWCREIAVWDRKVRSLAVPLVLPDKDPHLSLIFYGSPPATFGRPDAGERTSLMLAVDAHLRRRVGHCVFVSDDEKAKRAFLDAASRTLPFLQLWNSASVVLYVSGMLGRSHQIAQKDIANALQDVRSNMGGASASKGLTDKLVKLTKQHNAAATRLAATLNMWR